MSRKFYLPILGGHPRIHLVDGGEWSSYLHSSGPKRIAHDVLFLTEPMVMIHTFLHGLSEGPEEGHPYDIYTTTVQGGAHDGYKHSWSTHREALDGHKDVFNAVLKGGELPW